MKLLTLVLCCLLASCASMTPKQKKYTAMGLSILAIGMIAAHDSDNDPPPASASGGGAIGPGPSCRPQPDGGCR
jgi:hypothetical protein